MPTLTAPALKPRKTPVQTRSSATVDAILQATLQVLVRVGKEKLTTTLVAQRAGVSVGTLYQYFPNKSALLQATLRRHLNHVLEIVENSCRASHNRSIFHQAHDLIEDYLDAKLNDVNNSAMLYAIATDVDGMRIAQQVSARAFRSITALFSTATEPLSKPPEIIATVVTSAINGVLRRLLEDKSTHAQLPIIRRELHVLVETYLHTCIRNRPSR